VAYADTLLANGERVIRVAHQHWFVLIWRARWAILAIIVAALAGGFRALNSKQGGFGWDLIGWIVLALLVIGLASLGWGLLTFRSQEFVITSRRIIHAEGVVNKKATDSSLEKINDAVLTESLFGRIFGFGDLEVLTASESGIERLEKLRDAKEFKKSMLEAKHELEIELSRPTTPPMRTTESTTFQSAPAPLDAVPADPVPAPAPAWGAAPAVVASAPIADTRTANAVPELAAVPASADVPAIADVPAVDSTAPAPSRVDDAPTAPVNNANDVANALERLGTLRDQGLVTPEEFAAKKAELLSRL
jgi:hypothetical protein